MGVIDWLAKRRGYVPAHSVDARRAPPTVSRPTRPAVRRVPVNTLDRRRFEAGNVNRLTADLPVSSEHINRDLQTQARILIARARWLQENDDYVRRFFRLVLNNVVGSAGIQLNAVIPNRGEPGFDVELNAAIESEFRMWGKRGMPDVCGVMSWKGIQKAALRTRVREGEAILVKHVTGPWGLQLELMDNLRVPYTLNDKNRQTGNQIVMGVELNASSVPVAYYREEAEDRSRTQYSYGGRWFSRIPASRIIHLWEPEFAEQVRGFSEMVAAMRRLPMLNGYEEAALVAARVSASKFAVWERENADDFVADEEGDDGELREDIEPGIIERPPPGYKLNYLDFRWPNTEHGEFVKGMLRGMASGLGVSYNTLANDLEGVNLSSIRHGAQEDREQWKNLQNEVIEGLCEPVYREWLDRALGLGRIKVRGQPKQWSPENVERMSQVQWRPRRWEFPEPLKDRQAQQLDLQMRTTSPSQIIRDRGLDPEEVWSEYARDAERLEALGIPLQLETDGASDDEQTSQQQSDDQQD